MKWIKLFEEYNQEDDIEAANVFFMAFELKRIFDRLVMKKTRNSDGDTCYWYYNKHVAFIVDNSGEIFVHETWRFPYPVDIYPDGIGIRIKIHGLTYKALNLFLNSDKERLLRRRRFRWAEWISSSQIDDIFKNFNFNRSIKWDKNF